MNEPRDEEMAEEGESPLEILDKICEEMKNLLTSAETLMQLEPDESVPDASTLDGPDAEEASA